MAQVTPAVLDAEIIDRLGRLGDTLGEDLLGQLTGLARLCARMEAAGAADDLTGCRLLLEEVQTELESVRSALRSLATP